MQIDEVDFKSFISIKLGLSEGSIRHCMIRLKIINEWFIDKELTKENIEQFLLSLKEKGLKNNSLNTYRFVFRHIASFCKDRGLPSDFFDGFKAFKKTKADIIIFTQEEIEQILNTTLSYGKFRGKDCSFLDFRYRTLTMFLAYTGCRYAEAGELRIKRLDLSAGRAIFINTKTNENRTVFITEPLISSLNKLVTGRDPNDYVFRNAIEQQVNVSDYSEDLKKRARSAGITKRTFPHNFRHSYITHMLEAGVPITEVAMLVGHKDIRTTFSTYMHLADKTLEKAAMRHPMVRKSIDPKEVIRELKELIENYQLEKDTRFQYIISQGDKGLNFELKLK